MRKTCKQYFVVFLGLFLFIAGLPSAFAADSHFLDSLGSTHCAAGHADVLHMDALFPRGDSFTKGFIKRHHPPDARIDFLHLRGEIEVNPEQKTVRGTVLHRLTPRAEATQNLVLHAGKRLMIEKVVGENDAVLDFRHEGEELSIQTPQKLTPGTPYEITVHYQGKPTDGMYFVKARTGSRKSPEVWTQGETTFNRDWIPLWDYPNEMFTTELIVKVPRNYVVIGNGTLVSEKVDRKSRRRVFHYKQDKPHVGYLLSLSIGRFKIVKDKAKSGLPLWYVVYPEDEKHIPRNLGRTPDVVEKMTDMIGTPYPWTKYAQTVASSYPIGGMENISATTLNRERAVYGASAGLIFDGMPLLAHELAHQWFGDLITCSDWAHIWLNEGFATYFETMYMERSEGVERMMEGLARMKRWYIGETKSYKRAVVTYNFERPGSMFDGHTYSKGAWVLHMLRRELGDTLFFKGVHKYVERHAYQVVNTDDLVKAMEDATGRSLHAFFDQWIYRPGHPLLEVHVSDDPKRGLARVHVKQNTDEPYLLDAVVRLTYKEGLNEERVIHVSEPNQVFYLTRRAAPQTIEFDPDGNILKEMSFTGTGALLRAQTEYGSTLLSKADAAKSLGKKGHNLQNIRSLDRLLNQAGHHRFAKMAAAKSLGNIGSSEACAVLRKGLLSNKAHARLGAAKALGNCHGPLVIKALRRAVSRDPSVHVVAETLRSLGRQDDDAPRSILESSLSRKSWNDIVASGAIEAVADIDEGWALQTLKRTALRQSARPKVRVAAIRGLATAADRTPDDKPSILDTARQLVDNSDPFVVRETLRLIARHGTIADLGYLEQGIKRVPEKWYHKEIEGWRMALRKRASHLPSKQSAGAEVKRIKRQLKKFEERLRDLEAAESPISK